MLRIESVSSQEVREYVVAHRGTFIHSYVSFGRIQGTRLKGSPVSYDIILVPEVIGKFLWSHEWSM